MADKILYLACFGFGIGVLWRSFLLVDLYTIAFVGLLYVLLIVYCIVVLKKNWYVLISIFIVAFLFGILRFQIADIAPPPVFEAAVGHTVSLSGMVTDEPAKSEREVKLIIKTTKQDESTKIVVFAKNDTSYQYGDVLQVTGVLEKPKNFTTDQGLEFDYVHYLRKDSIFYTIHNPNIEIIASNKGSLIKHLLFSIKERFDAAIAEAIPSPESIVLRGIILGERAGFSQPLRQLFMDTGTIHVVTIGGYHVTLVAGWIMSIFSFLPKYAATGAGIISIFLYILITGGAQTSIRAGIMATLALLAGITGRRYEAGRALIIAATAMVLINPFVLAYDISFELSFMATIAIIFLSPRLEPYLLWIPWKWLRDIVAITASMYVFALPFILYRMGNLSLVSLPANIAIVPLMPLSMIMGFITGFVGLLSSTLALFPGIIAYALLHYQITIIDILANIPFAALTIPDFPLALIVLIYAMFCFIFLYKETKEESTIHEQVARKVDVRFLVLLTPFIITLLASGFLYYRHYEQVHTAKIEMEQLLNTAAVAQSSEPFTPDTRTAESGCLVHGPYPDHTCTPGAVFEDATVEQICVPGYTKTVRNVSTKLRKEVFAEYNLAYPEPKGAYEVDHFIPLALGGSNDIANLFPESANPTPGFHEKDVVEVYLQHEVCAGRVTLPAAQRQISTDWLAVYNNLTPEEIRAIRQRYGNNEFK